MIFPLICIWLNGFIIGGFVTYRMTNKMFNDAAKAKASCTSPADPTTDKEP